MPCCHSDWCKAVSEMFAFSNLENNTDIYLILAYDIWLLSLSLVWKEFNKGFYLLILKLVCLKLRTKYI